MIEGEMQLRQTINRLTEHDFLRTILTNLPAIVYVIAPDGTIVFAEGRGFAVVGSQKEDIVGTNVSKYYSVHPQLEDIVRRVLEGETLTSTVLTPNQRSLETVYSPLRDDGGAVCGVIGIAQDITERIEQEQALRESEEKFRNITSAAIDAIIMMDQTGRISMWNDAAQVIFGYTEQEVIGQNFYQLITPKRCCDQRKMESIASLGENLLTGKIAELIVKRKSGEEFPIELSLSAFRLHDRWYAVGTARDITERKQVENIMQARLRLLEFANSHSMDELLTATLDEIEALTGSTIGFYHFVESDQETLSLQNWSTNTLKNMCTAEGKGNHYGVAQAGVWADCIGERGPVVHNDYASLPHRKGMPDGHALVVREVVVPIFRGSMIMAIVGVGNKLTNYDERDIEIVSQLGDLSWDITERKRAEEALQASEERFSILFDKAPLGYQALNEEGYFIEVNQTWLETLGYSREEVIGKWFGEFLAPECVDVFRERFPLFKAAGEIHSEFQMLHKNGSRRLIAFEGRIGYNLDGSFKQTHCILSDITERMQAERELRESEEKFSRAFQSGAQMSITEADTDIFLDVNDAFLMTMGFSRDEIIGKTIQESGMLAEAARFAAAKQEGADSRHLRDQEMMVRTKSGDLRYGIFSADRINVGGKNCVLTVMTDITKRRLAEQALRESENAYRAIFENTGNATLILEGDTTISLVNSEFEKLTGYTKAETEGKMRWTEFVVEEDVDRMLGQHRLRRTDPTAALKSYEFRMRDKSGVVKHILLSIDMIPGTTKSVASLMDITARKRAQEEREQLQRQLQQSQKIETIGTMAGGIAHDFNNILTGILGFTELVRSEIPEDTEVYENLTEVVKAGRRARDLVRQILSFSRKAETEKSLISLVTAVKEALRLIRSVTPSHISIKQNFTASPARVILADPTQMHQMVMNICLNAADAMPDGGVLEISLEEVQVETESRPEQTQLPSGCYLKLTVRDNGAGMPPEVRERIFEPYFTTKQVGKGTGMGLAVVHGVIKEHGGSIAVSSEPGKGTAFEICLPIVEATPDTEIESTPVVVAGSESILFVGDETMITNLQRLQLGKWGYCVTATESSATALNMFRANPQGFDLVITDLTMPGITGIKLAQAIHEISPSTPIILCTGFDEGISRENAGTIGIHAILTKPITGAEFSCTIRMVLDEAFKPSPAKS
jgi:PAS domain S-box-containing protein